MKSVSFAALFCILMVSGTANAEQRGLSGFTGVSASAGARVEIAQGPSFSVEVTGREPDRIITRVSNGTLIVEPRPTWFWRRAPQALVRVQMPEIERVSVSSGARARATSVESDQLALSASSGASLDIAGDCGSVRAAASSGAHIRAADLHCGRGSIQASSGAEIHAFAGDRMDVAASSGARVFAYGAPVFGNTALSSGGALRRVD